MKLKNVLVHDFVIMRIVCLRRVYVYHGLVMVSVPNFDVWFVTHPN